MSLLRLISASLVASACILQAAAQAPATFLTPGTLPTTNPMVNSQTPSAPQALITKSLPSTFSVTFPQSDPLTAKPYSFDTSKFKDSGQLVLHADTQPLDMQAQAKALALLKKQEALLAQTSAPCYTLRVYGFTPQDLKSPRPHSSSETDCTPASSAHLKALQLPGTVNAK